MGQEFKGRIKLELDERALSAKLRFTPDDKAEKHSIDTLKKLLQEEHIVFGVDEEALKDAAEDFADAMEETLSEPIAQGEEPESGEGAVYEFAAMKYPPELESVARKIRSLNKAPVIYKIMKTVVKKDRRVKDKGGLFKSSREKIITVDEEVEKKIPVEVSPKVLELGLFGQGDLICTVKTSSGTEKPGKDVRGKEIKPLPVSKDEYLQGKHILKDKGEFRAEQAGFVRKGQNWLDLVPFAAHDWSVKVSENKADCFLNILAGHKAAPLPGVDEIKDAVEKLGYPADNLLIDEKIAKLIRSGCQSEGAQSFCLTRDRDSEFAIEINSLATEANLNLRKGTGQGSKLQLKKIWAKVLDLKIKGFEQDRVKQEILAFNKSDQLEITILLGKGEDPERGKDRELVVDADYLEQEKMDLILERMDYLRKTPDSFGEFPKDTIQKMALVKKGSAIFHLGAQSGGKNGRDIYGKTINGIEGNDPVVRLYENITIQEGKAVSAIDGILDYANEESVYSLRVRKHNDARVIVSVAENKMSASLSIMPPQGSGFRPAKETLAAALEERGVTRGIKEAALNEVLERAGKEELVTDAVVAEAKIPFREGTALKFLVDFQLNASHTVPVCKGDAVALVTPQEEGDALGCNVLGEQLLGEGDGELTADETLDVEEAGGETRLIAREKGLLSLEERRLFVKFKQVVKGDVSRTNGNIKFPGTIEILGSVLSGIFINAGNDLKIRDVVEASLLSAEGSILIGKGVKGDRKAVLRANKNISLGFAENSNIMTNGNIGYKKALMNCQVKCNGKVLSQDQGARIIGGKIKAKNGVTADSIGSERGGATMISFGQDYLVEDQINVMAKEIEEIDQKLQTLENMMQAAEQKGQQRKLMELRKKKFQLLKVQEKKVVKNFLLKDKFELHFDSEIKVTGSIFPGTVFESHGRKLEVTENLSSAIVFFDSNTGKISTKRI